MSPNGEARGLRLTARQRAGRSIAALAVSASLVAACTPDRIEAARVLSVRPPGRTAPAHPKKKPACTPKCLAWVRAVQHAQLVAYLNALWLHSLGLPPDAGTQQVMDCIKSYESGDYTEHSHPSSGSGAFQWIPSSFAAWFQRWRDAVEYVGSDYALAYEAPPLIQDAVTAYAITHGGAGNWSNNYGLDPCTSNV